MNIKEIIRTTGDIRRCIAQTMSDVRNGDISVDKAMCVASLAKEVTSSLQAEINAAKTNAILLKEGSSFVKTTSLGQMVIEDTGSVPTLDGTK